MLGRKGSWRRARPGDLERARDVEGLAALLTSAAPTPRRVAAAEALGRLGGIGAVMALKRGLRDELPEMREASLDALAAAGGDRAMGALLDTLDTPDPPLQGVALEHLVRAGEERVVPRLTAIILSPGHRLRPAAVGAVGGFPGSDARRALLMAIQDPDPTIADLAASALGKLAGPEAVSHLLRLRSPAALRALGAIGHPSALDGLLQTLGDPRDPGVRAAATDALRALERSHPELRLGLLTSTGGEVEALARCGDPRAAVPLCRWLFAADADHRVRACAGLAKLGDKSMIGTLEALLSDGVPEVCRAATEAIRALDPERDDDPLRATVAKHLARIERTADSQNDSAELLASIDFLARLGAPSARPAIGRLVRHPDPHVRRAAVFAAGLLDSDP